MDVRSADGVACQTPGASVAQPAVEQCPFSVSSSRAPARDEATVAFTTPLVVRPSAEVALGPNLGNATVLRDEVDRVNQPSSEAKEPEHTDALCSDTKIPGKANMMWFLNPDDPL